MNEIVEERERGGRMTSERNPSFSDVRDAEEILHCEFVPCCILSTFGVAGAEVGGAAFFFGWDMIEVEVDPSIDLSSCCCCCFLRGRDSESSMSLSELFLSAVCNR